MGRSYGQLRDAQSGRVVVARLEAANTVWKQAVGLLGRRELAEDEGLCLATCNGIHTLFMRFALDVVFLDRDGVALRLISDLRPWRFCGPVLGARTVIELPAGTIARRELKIGDRYELTSNVSL